MVSPTRQRSGPRIDQDIEPPYSPLERIAIAFMKQDYPNEIGEDGSLTELGYLYWHRKGFYYVQDARALLRALREPSGDMINAGQEAPSSDDTGIVWPVGIYQAMIDAALEEG